MRPRDPRRLLPRATRALARVRIIEEPEQDFEPGGSVSTRQAAEITLPRAELERIWTPEYLERLARTYWLWLGRISLGLLRVVYTPYSREVVLLRRPLVLLRFHAPEYDISADHGAVTWRINRGLLVSPPGRGRGYLRIAVQRLPERERDAEATVRVTSEVSNFYPMLAAANPGRGPGVLARLGRYLYGLTQLRIHVVVTHAFLRSLARLDLEPSVVGALRAAAALDPVPGEGPPGGSRSAVPD